MSQITKRALEQSLTHLLTQKPLNKITIADITDDCGINRMTFYYHFKDIYDLVEWSCLEWAQDAIRENRSHDTWQEGFVHVFYSMRDNKALFANVYHCIDREHMEQYLKPLVDHLLMGVVEEESKGLTVRDEDKAFIANIYSYIFVGLTLDWIKNDMREEPERMIRKLARALQGSFRQSLERFRVDRTSNGMK